MTQTIKIDLSKIGLESEPIKSDIQAEIRDDELYITGIPDKDKLEYVARDIKTKTKLFIVHGPEEELGYSDSFRLHIGKEAQLIEAQIQNVRRYRDGGTTNIDYVLEGDRGRLYFPTPLDKETKPTDNYRGKTIELEELV